jgi:ADP-heptose:LPS heptosyltransferase
MARGAAARGELVAFGDGHRLRWGPYSEMIFRNNPNIARAGQERQPNVRWVPYYKGNRLYNRSGGRQWLWNYSFKAKPGEIYFEDREQLDKDVNLILIEPNVPNKPCAPNKQWPIERWQMVAKELIAAGFKVRQFEYGAPNLAAPSTLTANFRAAAALIKSARLAILPEGGLHHAAAAVGTPAVVLFGGFVPPAVLGYDEHINLTGNTKTACGSFTPCPHCIKAMQSISVDDVLKAAEKFLCN